MIRSDRFNCPDRVYDNCANARKKCLNCASSEGDFTKTLHYSPINKNLDKKSVEEIIGIQQIKKRETKKKVDKSKSRYVKKGLQEEKNVAENIVKKTLASGRINGDGDLKILRNSLALQADVKTRNKTSNFTVTWEEYSAGKVAGTNLWIISVPHKIRKEQVKLYCLTEVAFLEILSLLESQITITG